MLVTAKVMPTSLASFDDRPNGMSSSSSYKKENERRGNG
jgi:hypothetical protein